MANGQMFLNGVDVGTSNHTQFGMTGDQNYVIAKFIKQTSDKRGNTVAIYNVYNKFDMKDMSALCLLNGGVKPTSDAMAFLDDLMNAHNSNRHERMRSLFNDTDFSIGDIKDMILDFQEEGKYMEVSDEIFKDITGVLQGRKK